jgi:peroxiredoxin
MRGERASGVPIAREGNLRKFNIKISLYRSSLTDASVPVADRNAALISMQPYRCGARSPCQNERKLGMTIAVGDKLPDVKIVKATAEGPEAVQSTDYFKGKKVALFSVPGAFTPTCSAKHLPGYVEKAADLKAKGIDEIACTAVNDAFVMKAWGAASGSSDVTMLADGNGDLAEALGLTMDGSGFGLGKRGQRFSMVVNDGVVEQLFVEAPGDFKVSSAEHMIENI